MAMKTVKDDAISNEVKQLCACCGKIKLCKMYVLQSGYAEFVCNECRTGKYRGP